MHELMMESTMNAKNDVSISNDGILNTHVRRQRDVMSECSTRQRDKISVEETKMKGKNKEERTRKKEMNGRKTASYK